VSFVIAPEQFRAMAQVALEVVAQGRPLCQWCQLPMDPDGHNARRATATTATDDGEHSPRTRRGRRAAAVRLQHHAARRRRRRMPVGVQAGPRGGTAVGLPLRDAGTREVLAYEVSAAMGLDIVPTTVEAEGRFGPGSAQRFIDEDVDFDPRPLYVPSTSTTAVALRRLRHRRQQRRPQDRPRAPRSRHGPAVGDRQRTHLPPEPTSSGR
jgi:hypothetical protein